MSSNFGGFLLGILSGLISSGVFFGIAALLKGQETILSELYILNNRESKPENTSVACKKCDNEYSSELQSCPYCNNSPTK